MLPVKSKTSETFDAGKDSQRIRLMDENPYISATLNISTSGNQHDKILNEEMLFTVAYVKNESTSNALGYNSSDSIENEGVYGHHLINNTS